MCPSILSFLSQWKQVISVKKINNLGRLKITSDFDSFPANGDEDMSFHFIDDNTTLHIWP